MDNTILATPNPEAFNMELTPIPAPHFEKIDAATKSYHVENIVTNPNAHFERLDAASKSFYAEKTSDPPSAQKHDV